MTQSKKLYVPLLLDGIDVRAVFLVANANTQKGAKVSTHGHIYVS
jgi:hypothetical protein